MDRKHFFPNLVKNQRFLYKKKSHKAEVQLLKDYKINLPFLNRQCDKNAVLTLITAMKKRQIQKKEQNCHDPKYNQNKFGHPIFMYTAL